MSGSKSLIFLKLGVLVGVPLSIVVGLLGTGIYLGDAHRETVLNVESFVWGGDAQGADAAAAVEHRGEVGEETTTAATRESPAPSKGVGAEPKSSAPSADEVAGGVGDEVAGGVEDEVAGGAEDEVAGGAGEATALEAAAMDASTGAAAMDAPTGAAAARGLAKRDPFAPPSAAPSGPRLAAVASPPPIPDDLVGSYMAERTLSVRVLVDPALVTLRPDWIDYVQRVVSVASANLRAFVGVDLSLHGVGRLGEVVPSGAAGLAVVKEASREGADLLLLFTARAAAAGRDRDFGSPAHAAGRSLVVDPAKRQLGSRAVIVGSPGEDIPHTWSLVHEVAHLMGAEDITDVRDPAWSSDSIMTLAPLKPAIAPSIDPANLRRMLSRKSWPLSAGLEEVEVSHGE